MGLQGTFCCCCCCCCCCCFLRALKLGKCLTSLMSFPTLLSCLTIWCVWPQMTVSYSNSTAVSAPAAAVPFVGMLGFNNLTQGPNNSIANEVSAVSSKLIRHLNNESLGDITFNIRQPGLDQHQLSDVSLLLALQLDWHSLNILEDDCLFPTLVGTVCWHFNDCKSDQVIMSFCQERPH